MDYVTLKKLAQEFGLDRSNTRKYVLAAGFEPVKIRTPESRGQLTLALTVEDAEAVRELREKQGFVKMQPVGNGDGYFYVIQLLPNVKPERVKLGYTNDVNARLASHKTVAPDAVLLASCRCRRSWETAAIASITRDGCMKAGQEVFDCADLDKVIDQAHIFFGIMPDVQE